MSGRINYSNLSDSLKEHLNGLGLTEEQVNELINNALVEINEKDIEQDEVVNGLVEKVGEINRLMTTEKGSLVGAINELFQSANNGKELIANAIGEPLNAEDTFSAMSNDINGLLSTFKTNMMNNGILVESGDRFKTLIDKIATMVEEGSGKGIQFAEGTFNITIVNNYNYDIVIDTNLDFNPTLLFLTCGPNVICSNIHNSQNNMPYFGGDTSAVYIYSFDSSSIILRGMTYRDAYNVSRTGTWYAIGVGEEDTTLRDSLASILQEEGIIITEDDDMASLISKVDEEFTKDNNTINNLTNELAGKVTPAGTAVASNVLSGKTFINSTGQTITGTMTNMPTHTQVAEYVAWNTDSIYLGIPTGAYVNVSSTGYPEVYINKTRLDSNLVPENIVSGKSICGVTGSATVSNLGGCNVVAGNVFTVATKQLSDSSSLSISETSYTISSIPQGVVRVNIEIKTAGTVQQGPICNFYHNGQLIAGDITGRRGYVYDKDFDIQVKNGDVFKINMKPRTTATYNYCTMTIYFSLS